MTMEFEKSETAYAKHPEPVIEIKQVDMIFNIASVQLNNLKEYFISLIRRQLYYREFLALKGTSITINASEVYGIVGINGSGNPLSLK